MRSFTQVLGAMMGCGRGSRETDVGREALVPKEGQPGPQGQWGCACGYLLACRRGDKWWIGHADHLHTHAPVLRSGGLRAGTLTSPSTHGNLGLIRSRHPEGHSEHTHPLPSRATAGSTVDLSLKATRLASSKS